MPEPELDMPMPEPAMPEPEPAGGLQTRAHIRTCTLTRTNTIVHVWCVEDGVRVCEQKLLKRRSIRLRSKCRSCSDSDSCSRSYSLTLALALALAAIALALDAVRTCSSPISGEADTYVD